MSKNYFDEHGNYMNVENLTLGEIYKRGYEDGSKSQKYGQWADNHNGTFTCTECGARHGKSNFCPNCGADMRGIEHDTRRSSQECIKEGV